MNYLLYVIILLIVFYIGATAFSYVNFVAYKLPKKESITEKKSLCRFCGHEEKVRDVLPIISWITHKGKCIYCSEKRPIRELIVEIIGGFVAVAVVCYYRLTPASLLVFTIYSILMLISLIDMDTKEIPLALNIIVLVLGIISIWIIPYESISILDRIIGAGAVSLLFLFLIIVTRGSVGGGDLKLMLSAGILLGWRGILFAFFTGIIIAGITALIMLIRKKATLKDSLAIGQFLSLGTAISLYAFLGEKIVSYFIVVISFFLS